MAAGTMPAHIGVSKQRHLERFADKTFHDTSIEWQKIFHERIYEYKEIEDFNPIRVYYRPHGFYIHTYSSPILESGYFITRKGEKPPTKKYLKFSKVGKRVYQYRIESSYSPKK